MARPQKNTVDYFPFICEDGNKMFYIEETYGNDGFAVFVKLLRELAKTNYHYLDLSKPTTMMFLSAKCKVSREVLEAIINDLVMLEKFDKMLWEENKIIWCQDFVDSIQDAYLKRNNKCITYEGLVTLLISLGVRKPNKSNSQGNVKPQTILNYTKLEDNKVDKSIPDFEEFLSFALEKEPSVCEKDLKRKYDSWVLNNWKDGNNKKIINWKSKLLNTLKYIDKITTNNKINLNDEKYKGF